MPKILPRKGDRKISYSGGMKAFVRRAKIIIADVVTDVKFQKETVSFLKPYGKALNNPEFSYFSPQGNPAHA